MSRIRAPRTVTHSSNSFLSTILAPPSAHTFLNIKEVKAVVGVALLSGKFPLDQVSSLVSPTALYQELKIEDILSNQCRSFKFELIDHSESLTSFSIDPQVDPATPCP